MAAHESPKTTKLYDRTRRPDHARRGRADRDLTDGHPPSRHSRPGEACFPRFRGPADRGFVRPRVWKTQEMRLPAVADAFGDPRWSLAALKFDRLLQVEKVCLSVRLRN